MTDYSRGPMKNSKPNEYVRQFGTQKVSKVTKYGWEIVNEPGEYMMIEKRELNIPVEYQRTQKYARVLEIAKNWDWMACGALCVVVRDNNKYYVVDGGHRKAAADKRADIKELPCLVFIGESLGAEAESFLNINTNRSAMTIFEKFRAMIEAGDTEVIECAEMISTTGHYFGKSTDPLSVKCISAVLKAFRANREIATKLWPLCVEIHNGEIVHVNIWSGLWWLAVDPDVPLFDKTVVAKLTNAGKMGCLQSINKSKILLMSGGEKTSAHGLLALINWRRKNPVRPKSFMGGR